MPYISQEDREYIRLRMKAWDRDVPGGVLDGYTLEMDIATISNWLQSVPTGKTKGAFNYFVTRLLLETFWRTKGQVGYTSLSDGVRVLRDIANEIERRILNPYEDKAIEKNGDLPEFERLLK